MRLGWLVVTVALIRTATAQPAEDSEPAQVLSPAEQAFVDGRALVEEGKHAEACAKFETSLRLDPDAAGTMLNLGLCNERLGRTATALGWFRKAQIRAGETGMSDYEDVAKNSTFMLAVRVPTLQIVVDPATPAGSSVMLDGRPVPDVELGKIELDPGRHSIELLLPGNAPPVRHDISVKDGDKQTITLAPPRARPAVITREVVTREIDHGVRQRRLAYAIGGAGVALWAGSLAVSLSAKATYEGSEHPEDWRRAQQLARFGGTGMFVAGTAAIAGAMYLHMRAPGIERTVTPVVGTEQLGLAVHGAF